MRAQTELAGLLVGLLVGALAVFATATAAIPGEAAGSQVDQSTAPWSDALRRPRYEATRQALQAELRDGSNVDGYRRILRDNDFTITAVNLDQPDRLEVEIARDDLSYEMILVPGRGQQTVDQPGARLRLGPNQWLADATRRAVQEQGLPVLDPGRAQAQGAMFRDSAHRPAWERARDELEQALVDGHKADEYRRSLARLGYVVTARHEKQHAFAEYEIVRGDLTFEIRIERNPITLLGQTVRVNTNLWRAADTWAALDDDGPR